MSCEIPNINDEQNYISIDYHQIYSQHKIRKENVDFEFTILPHHMCSLKIYLTQNYLEPINLDRFKIWNVNSHLFEQPIQNHYILLKEHSYYIFNNDKIQIYIESLQNIYQ
jgi:hypothetical protein